MRLVAPLYGILSWGIVLLGTVHMVTTAALTATSPAGRVWFFGAGMAMVLTGALNLLNSAYGASAVGVRLVCVASNVLMTCFAVVAGFFTNAGPAQSIVVLGLVGGTTALSLLRKPFRVSDVPPRDVPGEMSRR